MRGAKKNLRLLFLTHYFPPEVGAPQSRIDETTKILAERGHRVTVLTNFPHYPDGLVKPPYKGRLLQREVRGRVEVLRAYVWARPNRGFVSRMANHLSFCFSSIIAAGYLGKYDVVVTESPPLFLGFSGWLISRMLGSAHVFNVADVWPQSAVEMGALKNALAIGMAERLEAFIYRHSQRVTVVTEGIRRDLIGRGLPDGKVATLSNGVDLDFFRLRGLGHSVKRSLGLEGRKIVLYAGTHGMAQGLRVVIEAAEMLLAYKDIVFVLAGDGAEKPSLMEEAKQRCLTNVVFLKAWPKAEIPGLLETADMCLVTLRDLPVFQRALPSKMYEAMAMARPLVISAKGQAADMVAEAGCGLAVAPEDPKALAGAIQYLCQNRARAETMGENGRIYVEKKYSRQSIALQWERLLRETANG